ncbi:MAG: hypothetical protein WKG07_29655 [Hymenobacter sp.]
MDLTKLTLKRTHFAYAQNAQAPVTDRVVNPAEAVRKLTKPPIKPASPGPRQRPAKLARDAG